MEKPLKKLLLSIRWSSNSTKMFVNMFWNCSFIIQPLLLMCVYPNTECEQPCDCPGGGSCDPRTGEYNQRCPAGSINKTVDILFVKASLCSSPYGHNFYSQGTAWIPNHLCAWACRLTHVSACVFIICMLRAWVSGCPFRCQHKLSWMTYWIYQPVSWPFSFFV